MLRAAVTGGIGTGKSVVLAQLAECGASVVDADTLVHDAMGPGMPATSAIRRRFGEDVIGSDGAVDRGTLGAIVFQDDRARHDLEAILHPAAYQAIEAWLRAQASSGAQVAVAEIPLLFETGHERDFDCVIVTACDAEVQLRRVIARSGLSEADARRRIAAQWPLADKIRRADFVIRTDGSVEATRQAARSVWDVLRKRADVGYSTG